MPPTKEEPGCLAIGAGSLVCIAMFAAFVGSLRFTGHGVDVSGPHFDLKGTLFPESHLPPPPKPDRTYEITEAVRKGVAEVSASGRGLASITVTIESRTNEALEIKVPLGTEFDANSGGTQNMIARAEGSVFLSRRGDKQSVTIHAAGTNMHKNAPREGDSYTVRLAPFSEDLGKLLGFRDFRMKSFRVQQFAIWTIADNPRRDGFVGVGESGFLTSPDDLRTGPDDLELVAIKALLKGAGIPPGNYGALR
jgi:hypothetical protein